VLRPPDARHLPRRHRRRQGPARHGHRRAHRLLPGLHRLRRRLPVGVGRGDAAPGPVHPRRPRLRRRLRHHRPRPLPAHRLRRRPHPGPGPGSPAGGEELRRLLRRARRDARALPDLRPGLHRGRRGAHRAARPPPAQRRRPLHPQPDRPAGQL
ncbi:MAG: Uncharacterized cysteine-rich DUF326 protein bsYhjQ/STM1261, partial [uncultured Quadrisphaera sp.]